MPDSTGLLPFGERFPDRCIDVGIAEQHAVTAAAGMAMGGLRPVVAVYSTFLTRAFDQVNLDVGLHGSRSCSASTAPASPATTAPSHHGVLDMVLLSKVPGMTVFAPSSYQELQVDAARRARDHAPARSRIRWPKTAARTVAEDEVGHGLRGRRSAQGARRLHPRRRQDARRGRGGGRGLAAEGCRCTVWDARVVKPLDPAMLDDAARHPLVVTAEDGLREGGVGSAIADAAVAAHRPAVTRVRVLGVPVTYIAQGKPDAILPPRPRRRRPGRRGPPAPRPERLPRPSASACSRGSRRRCGRWRRRPR